MLCECVLILLTFLLPVSEFFELKRNTYLQKNENLGKKNFPEILENEI